MGIVAPAVELPAAVPDSLRQFLAQPEAPQGAIKKISYTHDSMIDFIIANPWVNQGDIAKHYGYTQGWVSQVFASDAFQHRLAERKEELVDPVLRASIEEKFKALVNRSFAVLMGKLEKPDGQVSDETALRAMEIASKALGYGARDTRSLVQNNNFVVQLPAKAGSVEEWTAQHAPFPARQPLVLEATAVTLDEGPSANAKERPRPEATANPQPAETAAPGIA